MSYIVTNFVNCYRLKEWKSLKIQIYGITLLDFKLIKNSKLDIENISNSQE